MQGYESIFITDPDLSEEALTGILDKIKNTVTDQGGEVQQYHLWGRRRLAYLINKKAYGTYHLFYITGGQEMLKSLAQQYRFTEEIIRFQTIRVENIQEESERFLQLIQKSAEPENVERKGRDKTRSANDGKKVESRSEKPVAEEKASEKPASEEKVAQEPEAVIAPPQEEEKVAQEPEAVIAPPQEEEKAVQEPEAVIAPPQEPVAEEAVSNEEEK